MAYLSVMIPVYNGEELVSQAIESVLCQPCGDWEIIIMNDGSTDNTESICKAYAEKDSRIKVYSHANVGLGKNRNLGFEHLSGKWTIFLDHDDLIINGFYTLKMIDFLEKCTNKNIDVIVPARIKVDYEANHAKIEYVLDEYIVDGGNDPSWKIKYEFATMIYSTGLLLRENLRFYEDRPEMESIFRHKAVYLANKVLFTNRFYFAVRRGNPASISNTWNYLKVVPVRFRAYEELAQWHKIHMPEDIAAYNKSMEIIAGIIKEYILLCLYDGMNIEAVLNNLKDIGMYKYIELVPDEFPVTVKNVLELLKKLPILFAFLIKLKKRMKSIIYLSQKANGSLEYPYLLSQFEAGVYDFSSVYEELSTMEEKQ